MTIGNRLLISLNGHGDCEGDNDIRDMYTKFPSLSVDINFASMTWFANFVTTNFKPYVMI